MDTVSPDFLFRSPQIGRRAALSRLGVGFIGAIAFRNAWGAPHFWEARPASQWSGEEVAQLVTSSPWAKQVTAQYRVALEGLGPRPDSQPRNDRGGGRGGECGLVPCGDIMPGTVVVIWESAQPVRDGLHPRIPPEFNGHYVLSIRGLAGEFTEEGLLQGASLTAKGKSPLRADLVRRRNNSWLFGFDAELLPLVASDKDVQFSVRIGANFSNTLVRAGFNPKEMIYQGSLAL